MRRFAVLFALAFGLPEAHATDVPYGSKEFYPSPERPVGYRGDGNGWFPGATPVAEWWEGTPVEKELDYSDNGKPKKKKYWDFSDANARNIAWKTEMPGWANTQPVVIGDRVVTYGEPDLVICCDANSGKILWTTAVNPWAAAGVDAAKAETARKLGAVRDALELVVQLQWHFGTCGRYLSTEQLNPILQGFLDKDLGVVAATLKELDAGGNYASRIVTPNAIWLCLRDAAGVDPATGAVLAKGVGGEFRILAGTKLVWCDNGSNNAMGSRWSGRREDGKTVMPFGVADVTDPKAVKILSTRNVLGGVNLPRHPLIESVLPATWKQEQFFNAKGGRPAHMVHTDTCMMPAGNRLFIRSVSHLYAIGDPAVPYDGRRTAP